MNHRIAERPRNEAAKSDRWSGITAISTLIMAVAAVIGLIFVMVQIEESKHEAKIQHLVVEIDEFQSTRFTQIRKSLATERIDTAQQRLTQLDPNDPPAEMYDTLNFCEDLGLLTRRKALDVHDVWDEFGYWLFPIYADARLVIDTSRKDEGPAAFAECSWLIEQVRPIEAKEDAGAEDHPSESDIYGFYMGEADAEPGRPSPRVRHTTKR